MDAFDPFGLGDARVGLVVQREPRLHLHLAVAPEQEVTRLELLDAAQQRLAARRPQERQVVGHGRDVELVRDLGDAQQRLDLRGEVDALAVDPVVEGLHADVVAGEQELALARVPDREREHAVQILEHVDAALFVEVDQDFRVGVAAEAVALALERLAQVLEVVDLAVERDLDRAVLVAHRLPGGVREVDDRQTPVPEADARRVVEPDAGSVRAPVLHRRVHRLEQLGAVVAGVSADAAHEWSPPALQRARQYTRRVRRARADP
ncbi:MAG: hypothetical protein MUF70_10720 [Myxococcota bacterium]|nr:hypothetical protein [Myxococcota bacterium]